MAISDDLPGVKVDITVNNIPLKEYENGGDEEERATTKYVESTTGQEFAISIELLPAFEFKGDCIGFRIEADGELLSKPAIARNSLRQYCVIKGLLIDDDQVEKFKFSDIDINRDGTYAEEDTSKLKRLGSIVVKCTHKMTIGDAAPGFIDDFTTPGVVAKKALKGHAVSHSVSLTASERCDQWTFRRTVPVFGQEDPMATFVFCYRSLASLKSMHIIPRTPSPEPIERRPAASLSTADIEELQQRLQAAENKEEAKVKIKREAEDQEPRARKRSRPTGGVSRFEIDDDGNLREIVVETAEATQQGVIELD